MLLVEAWASSSVSPMFRRESPSFFIFTAEATFLSNRELQEGHMNSLSDRFSLTEVLQNGHTPVALSNLPISIGVHAFLFIRKLNS